MYRTSSDMLKFYVDGKTENLDRERRGIHDKSGFKKIIKNDTARINTGGKSELTVGESELAPKKPKKCACIFEDSPPSLYDISY